MAKFYFEQEKKYRVVAFTVDDEFAVNSEFQGLPLIPFSEVTKDFPPSKCDMHVALSYSQLNLLRQKKYEQAKEAGYKLASYVCSKSAVWPDLSFGDNCFILENQTIQPHVSIGNNVMIWSGNHLGHGTTIESHVYIASHVVISGHCKIGERSFLGVNATIKDFCNIGKDSFITMGANVTREMPNGSVALAVSSEIYLESDRRARMIKKSYFNI